jgi:bifunctional UDP-N-acetylglucosamine pyrophosphorylase/glucosamine-1-phosphate N-acetyltransferase
VIERGCVLNDVSVAEQAHLLPYTVASESRIGVGCHVGPFAHLRPGTVLEDACKVGNFVETKKAHLGRGAKASHLSYLGDAEIGPECNIGAGTITCNYDGKNKFRTTLGRGVFIGSDTQLVAPVQIGDGAYVGAGTTVTGDVPAGALAISRTPQRNIEGWVARKKTT